jgi:hypothetical protein
MIEMALGHYPYPPETYANIFAQLTAIVHGDPPELPEEGYSDDARDFVARCLHRVPELRATYAELLVRSLVTIGWDSTLIGLISGTSISCAGSYIRGGHGWMGCASRRAARHQGTTAAKTATISSADRAAGSAITAFTSPLAQSDILAMVDVAACLAVTSRCINVFVDVAISSSKLAALCHPTASSGRGVI